MRKQKKKVLMRGKLQYVGDETKILSETTNPGENTEGDYSTEISDWKSLKKSGRIQESSERNLPILGSKAIDRLT